MKEKNYILFGFLSRYLPFCLFPKLKLPFLSLVIFFIGCNSAFFERGTQIKITNKRVPPEFKLQGNGSVLRLFFYGPYTKITIEEIQAKLADPPIWEISPPPNTNASDLPIIKYGLLPEHFTQHAPVTDTPQQLEEGKCYRIVVPTNGAYEGSMCFCINNNNASVVSNP